MAFISETYFSGLNWDPHPSSNPQWYLSSLSTTFRGWTQTQGSTPHWWLSSLNTTFRGWTQTEVQPPTNTFHLWTPLLPFISEHNFSGLNSDPRFNPPLMAFISEPYFSGLNWDPHPGSSPHWYLSSLSTTFRGWTQTRGSTPHWWLSSLNPTFRGWTGTHILVQPPTVTFHLWTQLFGVELRPEVQPPTGTFHLWTQLFGVEPMPIAINVAYGGHTASINLLSTKQTVHGNTNRNRTDFWFIHFARTETNPNEPKACCFLLFQVFLTNSGWTVRSNSGVDKSEMMPKDEKKSSNSWPKLYVSKKGLSQTIAFDSIDHKINSLWIPRDILRFAMKLEKSFKKFEKKNTWWLDEFAMEGRFKDMSRLHMGVSKNSGTPKWIVYNGKPY